MSHNKAMKKLFFNVMLCHQFEKVLFFCQNVLTSSKDFIVDVVIYAFHSLLKMFYNSNFICLIIIDIIYRLIHRYDIYVKKSLFPTGITLRKVVNITVVLYIYIVR